MTGVPSRHTAETIISPVTVEKGDFVASPEAAAVSAVLGFALTERALDLYGRIAAQSDDSPVPLDPEDPEVRLLLAVELLKPHPVVAGACVAADPKTVGVRLGLTMHNTAMDLLARATQLPQQMQALTDLYEAAQQPIERTVAGYYLVGLDTINARIPVLAAASTSELLTAQPGGKRRKETLDRALPAALAALERGVRMRTLYHASARFDAATRAYVEAVSAAGAEIRTLDEPFDRMIVIDGSKAIIPALETTGPAEDTQPLAVAIEDPAVVTYIQRGFERSWRRATPWDGRQLPARPREGVTPQDEEVARCLKEELIQSAAAKLLGVSERTYADRVRHLKKLLGVADLFMAGYRWREFEARSEAG